MGDQKSRAERFERGRAVIDAIDAPAVADVVSGLADVAPELAHQMVAWGFGDVYARQGLSPRDRQLLTLGILTALGGCERQLDVHVDTALRVGLTRDEILEAFLHAAVYCGFPRALNAVAAAKRAFDTHGPHAG